MRDHLDRTGKTAEAFASDHGFSAWSVRHWARGNKMPNRESQSALSIATAGAVSPEAWLAWSLAVPIEAAPIEQKEAA